VAEKLLDVKNIKTYFYTEGGLVKAVDGVSYDCDAGESIALVGESGSGKSVSALSIMRLIPNPPGVIEGGEVWFKGQDLLKLDRDELLHFRGKEIAMVFQEPMTSLNPVLTVGRQITETLLRHMDMTPNQARERAIELISMVGIPDPANRLDSYPHQYSGGMRQRVMIAMALSCEPSFLIADEPTTALDVTIQAQILELIGQLNRETGTAVMIITHNLGVVARYASRVNVMYAGRVIETGTSEEIYGAPRHPYTLGLLSSVPRLDEPRRQKLIPIEGLPPDLMNLPAGCPFRARCPYSIDICAEEYPPFEEVSPGHFKACWVDTTKVEARSRS
jgi:oligopeptide/dipeptide ABC transporter ATP-binding protein